MGASRRIRTILYGDQSIEATELDLLHTPALQRLYDLHQLGLSDRVFIDASHSRLQHVIGVLEQVDHIIEAIASNLERREARLLPYRDSNGNVAKISGPELGTYVRRRRRATRLMGLLHDLTHAPFGHTLEDEIELQDQRHDHPQRQADAFYRLLCQYFGWVAIEEGILDYPLSTSPRGDTESDQADRLLVWLDAPRLMPPPSDETFLDFLAKMSGRFVGQPNKARSMSRAPSGREMAQFLRDLRFAMRALLWLDALHKDRLGDLIASDDGQKTILDDGEYAFEKLIDRILGVAGQSAGTAGDAFLLQRDAFLLDIIGNTICADLLDYAKRDSHFAGLKLDYDVDRIVENFTVASYRRPRDVQDKSKRQYSRLEPILRTAISIFSHKLRIDVPGELMNLLQVRFYVYQRVLFHPTKCIAGAMLGSALQLIGWRSLPIQYRFVGDAVFLHDVGEVARLTRDLIRRHRESDPQSTLVAVEAKASAIFDGLPTLGLTGASRQLLADRANEESDVVLEDLTAAVRLLDRLSARRYHRPIFRLLPSAEIPELNLDAEHIASFFLDATKRAKAEREIENRGGLPRGAVTIHCPTGQGPKKIAEILILNEKHDQERAYPLREIASLNQTIFAKHQGAITAVEEMYRSMWRLIVSVAPPYHERYAELNKVIGRVLFAALSEERYDSIYGTRAEAVLNAVNVQGVPNDETMERELAGQAASVDEGERVRIVYPDGRHEWKPERYMQVAEEAVTRLESTDVRITGYIREGRFAAEGERMDVADVVREAIPVRRPNTRSREKTLGEPEPRGDDAQQQTDLLSAEPLPKRKDGGLPERDTRE